MSRLVFEKVGDINFVYPYLCVYMRGEQEPFMEIGVTDFKELQFTVYASGRPVVLQSEEWEEIQRRAAEFLPRVLADEDACS